MQIRRARTVASLALIESSGDLIHVPPDGTDLGDAALKDDEFSGRDAASRAQVRADEERNVRAVGMARAVGALAQQQ